jgi:hypothetical protein
MGLQAAGSGINNYCDLTSWVSNITTRLCFRPYNRQISMTNSYWLEALQNCGVHHVITTKELLNVSTI